MSDEELVATFKEVLQAKLPSSRNDTGASEPAAPPSILQQVPAKLQEFRLQWPGQQAPPPADSSDASMLSKLLHSVGPGASTAAAAGSSASEATNAGEVKATTSTPESTLPSDKPEKAQSSRLGSSSNDSQIIKSDGARGFAATSNEGLQSDQAGTQWKGPERASEQPQGQIGTATSEMSKESQPGEPVTLPSAYM